MTTNQRIILLELVLFVHMCSGETTISQREKSNTKVQENEQISATTTVLSVSPFIFSVDDYDALQDTESLQQALSIVAYEPQKIDQKLTKNKSKISKNIQEFEKTTLPYYTTTQMTNERKYYEVPRKQSNIKAHLKQEKESLKGSTRKIVQETSFPKRTHEKVGENLWKHETYHHRNDSTLQATSPNSLTKNNYKTISTLSPLPFQYSITEQTSLEPISGAQSNYSDISKYNDNKVDQTGSETSKSEIDVLKLKKQRKNEYPSPIETNDYYRLLESPALITGNDRVPRPFSLPTECNPVAQTFTYPTRTPPVKLNTLNYPISYLKQNIPASLSAEQPAASSIFSMQHNIRPTAPTKTDQLSYSRNLSNQDRTGIYSRIPTEETIHYQKKPLRRNYAPHNSAKQQAETRSIFPAQISIPQSTVPPTYEEPIIYSFTRRPENITARSSSLLRQYKGIARSHIPSKIEEKEIFSSAPERQNQGPTNSNILPKQQTTTRYKNIPRIRKKINYDIPIEHTVIHSTDPIKPTAAYQNNISKQKVIPEEQNLGHPTIVQPTYTWVDHENVNKNKEMKDDSSSSDDKDDFNNDSDGDSNENYSNTDDNENENDNHDDNDDNNASKNNNNHYSYNYNERYEEPSDEEPKKYSHAYKVKEENIDEPYLDPKRLKTKATHDRETQKKIDPDYDHEHSQYTDSQSSEQDPDYDQTRGQNTQHEVADTQKIHDSKGDKGDLVEEADHQHKKHHKPESHDEAEGHSSEGHENEHHTHGEKGHKGYKQFHEHDKAEKGYHDKEGHNHEYDEKEGKDKKHHETAGFHEEHEKGEEGEKKAAFKEKANHKKGHNTKGEHVIHKKDEFEKKTEFFDEFHEGGDIDKDGGYHEEHHHAKGGHHKKGHHHEGENEKKHGEKGKFDKGHHHHEKKGHDEHEGHDQHHHHEEKHGKKGAHEDAKKWNHKKGEKR